MHDRLVKIILSVACISVFSGCRKTESSAVSAESVNDTAVVKLECKPFSVYKGETVHIEKYCTASGGSGNYVYSTQPEADTDAEGSKKITVKVTDKDTNAIAAADVSYTVNAMPQATDVTVTPTPEPTAVPAPVQRQTEQPAASIPSYQQQQDDTPVQNEQTPVPSTPVPATTPTPQPASTPVPSKPKQSSGFGLINGTTRKAEASYETADACKAATGRNCIGPTIVTNPDGSSSVGYIPN